MTTQGRFADQATGEAFEWLTEPGSVQVGMLEDAMRNYQHPVYDPVDVGRHLLKALMLPMAGYTGDTSKVDALSLAVAIISHAIEQGWDVVEEVGMTE